MGNAGCSLATVTGIVTSSIDACATGLSPDLKNVPRPFGSAYDMGAHEFRILKVYLPLARRQ